MKSRGQKIEINFQKNTIEMVSSQMDRRIEKYLVAVKWCVLSVYSSEVLGLFK